MVTLHRLGVAHSACRRLPLGTLSAEISPAAGPDVDFGAAAVFDGVRWLPMLAAAAAFHRLGVAHPDLTVPGV